MCNCTLLRLILRYAVENYLTVNKSVPINNESGAKCESFLCLGDESCRVIEDHIYYHLISSATHIIINIGNSGDFTETLLKSIEIDTNWAQCFDKHQASQANYYDINVVLNIVFSRFGIRFALHGTRQLSRRFGQFFSR